MGMIKINVHLTRPQLQQLEDEKKESGIPVAESVRRAIDLYLEKMTRQRGSERISPGRGEE